MQENQCEFSIKLEKSYFRLILAPFGLKTLKPDFSLKIIRLTLRLYSAVGNRKIRRIPSIDFSRQNLHEQGYTKAYRLYRPLSLELIAGFRAELAGLSQKSLHLNPENPANLGSLIFSYVG